MLLAALDPAIKADLVVRRTTQVAAQIVFRLHAIYRPGGSDERNLQEPAVAQDVTTGVGTLRSWGRWYRRCVDCGMRAPDNTPPIPPTPNTQGPHSRGDVLSDGGLLQVPKDHGPFVATTWLVDCGQAEHNLSGKLLGPAYY